MKNLIGKITIGLLISGISFLVGLGIKTFSTEGSIYDVGWESWEVNANVLDNGDMEVSEKLVYFNDYFDKHHVSESLISFNKSKKSNAGSQDISYLKEDSFYVKVYDENKVYFDNLNKPTDNAYDYSKANDCLGFSWVDGCKDEKGRKITAENGYEKVFIYLEDGLMEGLTIEFKYTVENVITKYKDYSVLNWNFLGAYQGADNKNCKLTINLPEGGEILTEGIENKGFSRENMTVMGFKTINAKIINQSGSKIEVFADNLYDDFNDEVEMFISIPNSKVDLFPNIKDGDSNYSSKEGYEVLSGIINDALEDEKSFYNPYKYMEIIVIGISIIFIAINVLVIYICYNKYDKELISLFDYEYLREIPNENYSPSVASYLVNEQKLDVNSLNAEFMDLIRRGFISVDTNGQDLTDKKANFKFTLDQAKVNKADLTKSERTLINWYFGEIGNGINMTFDDLDEYMENASNAEQYNKSNNKWNEEVIKSARSHDWFDTNNKAKKFASLGVLTLFIVLIGFFVVITKYLSWVSLIFLALLLGSGVVIAIYTPTIKRKTQEGIDEYTKWMAFKKFLKDFSTFEDYPVPSLIIWEHFMVYATMFGIADLVEKQLRTRFGELNRIEEFDTNVYFRYRVYYYTRYRINNAKTIGMNSIAREKARQASSSGRSGGFGGGSSFGGGGRGGSFR